MPTKGFKDQILLLRRQGCTYREIEKQVGCSRANISYHCKKVGLAGPLVPQKDPQIIQKVKDLRQEGVLVKDIAHMIGLSHGTVVRYSERKNSERPDGFVPQTHYEAVRSYRQRMKAKGVMYLGGKCSECGYSKSVWSLHFHHKNPAEKSFTISRYQNLCWERVRQELEKCRLLCANCHGEKHEAEFNVREKVRKKQMAEERKQIVRRLRNASATFSKTRS